MPPALCIVHYSFIQLCILCYFRRLSRSKYASFPPQKLLTTRLKNKFKNERRAAKGRMQILFEPHRSEFIGPDESDNPPAGQSTDADLRETLNEGENAVAGETAIRMRHDWSDVQHRAEP